MKKRSQGEARASRAGSLLMKHLALLPGYPAVGGGAEAWIPFGIGGSGEALPLTRARLQRIDGAVTKLRVEHAARLPALVEDPEGWLRRMAVVLEQFKGVVHAEGAWTVERWFEADVMPRRIADGLRRLRGGLRASRGIFDSLLWIAMTATDESAADLAAWFRTHHEACERLADAVSPACREAAADAVRVLFALRADLPPSLTGALLDLLAVPACWVVRKADHWPRRRAIDAVKDDATRPSAERREKALVHSPTLDDETFGRILAGLPARLAALPRRDRAAVASLVETLLWPEVNGWVEEAATHQRAAWAAIRGWSKRIRHDRRGGLLERVRTACAPWNDSAPAESRLDAADELFGWMEGSAGRSADLEAWLGLVRHIPAPVSAARLRLVHRWWRGAYGWSTMPDVGRDSMIHEIRALFDRRGMAPAIVQQLVDKADPDSPVGDDAIFDLLCVRREGMRRQRRIARLFERLTYDRHRRPTEALVEAIDAVCCHVSDLGTAESILSGLNDDEWTLCDGGGLAEITKLARSADDVVALLRRHGRDRETLAAIGRVGESTAAGAIRESALRLALGGRGELLREWATLAGIMATAGIAWPVVEPAAGPTEWIGRYPAELRPDLERLAAASLDAERIAERVTEGLWPTPEALRTQLERIDATLGREGPGMARTRLLARREALHARLGRTDPLPCRSPGRLGRRLRERAEEEAIRRPIEAAKEHLRRRLATLTGIDPVPEGLFDAPWFGLVAGLLELPPETRSVGLGVLLRRRAGLSPAVLPHPANEAFIERVGRKGVDLAPWLDRSVEVRGWIEAGPGYVVRFSDDPLDTLMMGGHFGTCLSPSAENFFSAVSNTVDVNKRVAYAKTDGGRVVGRRLFALTDDGLIQVFRPYSHEPSSDRFEATSDRFARLLAEAMGTLITPRGNVSELVVSRWYDDGASPMPGAQSLSPAGDVAAILRDTPAPEMAERLRSVLGGEERVARHLLDLLRLLSGERPEVMPCLVDAIGSSAEAPAEALLALAARLHAAGDRKRAGDLLAALPSAVAVGSLEEACRGGFAVFEEVLPSEAMDAMVSLIVALKPAWARELAHRLRRPQRGYRGDRRFSALWAGDSMRQLIFSKMHHGVPPSSVER